MKTIKNKIVNTYKNTFKLNKSTNWLINNLEGFSIERGNSKEIPWQIKPVGELIFLLLALKKNAAKGKEIDDMCQFCIEQTQNFDWHELAAYDPSIVTVIYSLKDFYSKMGVAVPWEEEYVQMLAECDFFDAMDRVPYREMDLIYTRSLTDNKQNYLKSLANWFNDTTFGREQISTRYTIDDMYSLTHAIFYLTDMGTRPVNDVVDETTAQRMRTTLVSLAVSIARSNNIDVLGEVLICWIYADVPKTPLNKIIFDSMLSHILAFQTPEGAIAPNPRVFNKTKNAEALFLELYHTTLVSTLLFTNTPKWQNKEVVCH